MCCIGEVGDRAVVDDRMKRHEFLIRLDKSTVMKTSEIVVITIRRVSHLSLTEHQQMEEGLPRRNERLNLPQLSLNLFQLSQLAMQFSESPFGLSLHVA